MKSRTLVNTTIGALAVVNPLVILVHLVSWCEREAPVHKFARPPWCS